MKLKQPTLRHYVDWISTWIIIKFLKKKTELQDISTVEESFLKNFELQAFGYRKLAWTFGKPDWNDLRNFEVELIQFQARSFWCEKSADLKKGHINTERSALEEKFKAEDTDKGLEQFSSNILHFKRISSCVINNYLISIHSWKCILCDKLCENRFSK